MPRAGCRFTKRDVRVAIKAAEEAGKHVVGFRIRPDGEIVVETLPGQLDATGPMAYTREGQGKVEGDPWDERLKELGYRPRQ